MKFKIIDIMAELEEEEMVLIKWKVTTWLKQLNTKPSHKFKVYVTKERIKSKIYVTTDTMAAVAEKERMLCKKKSYNPIETKW